MINTLYRPPSLDGHTENPYPLFRLGTNPDPTIRREEALIRYGAANLINPADKEFRSNDPLSDIQRIRHTALTEYTQQALPRLRTGPVEIFSAPGGTVPIEDLYNRLEQVNNHEFEDGIITRVCTLGRVSLAIDTGTDRDMSSGFNIYGAKWGAGDFERMTMQDYGFDGQDDNVTYGSPIGPINIVGTDDPYEAVLIYAPPALQSVAYEGAYQYDGPFGFMVFIDPRLKSAALLAVVQSA